MSNTDNGGSRLRSLADRVLRRWGYRRIAPLDDAAVNALLWERNARRASEKWARNVERFHRETPRW